MPKCRSLHGIPGSSMATGKICQAFQSETRWRSHRSDTTRRISTNKNSLVLILLDIHLVWPPPWIPVTTRIITVLVGGFLLTFTFHSYRGPGAISKKYSCIFHFVGKASGKFRGKKNTKFWWNFWGKTCGPWPQQESPLLHLVEIRNWLVFPSMES